MFDEITHNCQEYINELRECEIGSILVRGYNGSIENLEKFNHDLTNRAPRNTPQKFHDKINEHYESVFGWKIRNGVFCYGFNLLDGKPKEIGYGPFFICFPIGEFEFVYSPSFFDMYGHINEDNNPIEVTIQNLDLMDARLCDAINSGEQLDNLGNEISVKTSSYYLVNFKYQEQIRELIWG